MEMRKEDRNRFTHEPFNAEAYNRSDRIIQREDGWYFTIRQGAAFGPYETRQHAEKHLDSFVSLLQ